MKNRLQNMKNTETRYYPHFLLTSSAYVPPFSNVNTQAGSKKPPITRNTNPSMIHTSECALRERKDLVRMMRNLPYS